MNFIGERKSEPPIGNLSLQAITIHIFLLQRLSILIKLIFLKNKLRGRKVIVSQGKKKFICCKSIITKL